MECFLTACIGIVIFVIAALTLKRLGEIEEKMDDIIRKHLEEN